MIALVRTNFNEHSGGGIYGYVSALFKPESGDGGSLVGEVSIFTPELDLTVSESELNAVFRQTVKDYALTNFSISIPDEKIFIELYRKGIPPVFTKYSGTTNSSGEYTVTYPVEKDVIPNVQPVLRGQSNTNQICMLQSSTTTGFTVKVVQRNTTTLLGIVVLQETVSNVNGATVDVLVTE